LSDKCRKINPFVLPQLQQARVQLLHRSDSEAQAGVGIYFSRKSNLAQLRISSILIIRGSDSNCILVNLHFSDVEQGLFTGQFAEIILLKLSFSCLPSFSCSAATVSKVSS